MEVRQSPLDELTFAAMIDWTDEMEEQVRHLLVYHNVGSAPKKGLAAYDRASAAYLYKCCLNSAVAQNALALDTNVRLIHLGATKLAIHFSNRDAAALFKLTWVGQLGT